MTHTLVLFSRRAPSAMSDELMLSGYRVFEALAVSEVLNLIDQEYINCVVIAPDVSEDAARFIAQYCVTLRVRSEATAADVLWELSQLFGSDAGVQ